MKLVDSNILIYAAQPEQTTLKAMLQGDDVAVSNISRLEVLGYHKITEDQKTFFNAVFSLVHIIEVDNNVINKAIKIRHAKNVKVGDAIIAATALLHSAELITRNVDDFKHLPSINITNPMDK
jgi:toxin FitB